MSVSNPSLLQYRLLAFTVNFVESDVVGVDASAWHEQFQDGSLAKYGVHHDACPFEPDEDSFAYNRFVTRRLFA